MIKIKLCSFKGCKQIGIMCAVHVRHVVHAAVQANNIGLEGRLAVRGAH